MIEEHTLGGDKGARSLSKQPILPTAREATQGFLLSSDYELLGKLLINHHLS
jgi:hypothetical protein